MFQQGHKDFMAKHLNFRAIFSKQIDETKKRFRRDLAKCIVD